ncbi:hypothetical protein [Niallia nealsonii]|uniref:Uncharacterized protein n=1 Tax=Niallia nealsonii TaxID=115979 RepID=A0A2N0Z561_9BACI|nr:hypothetical protein [Niallia nealsonii]PKG24656.1 hypothetical protein CWS01_05200 [Niallia nealsonii]
MNGHLLNDANEVFYEWTDKMVFAGSEEILPDLECSHLPDNQLDFNDCYEQKEEDIMPAEEKVVGEWFYQCRVKAGGQEWKLPSYFLLHDSMKSFDLKKKQWMGEEDK